MSRISSLFVALSAVTLLPWSAAALVIAGDQTLYEPPDDDRGDIKIVDGLAYVTSRNVYGDAPSVRILDLSDPASPVEIGAFAETNGANDVEVVGGLAYVAGLRDNRLRIFDVSDPKAVVEVGSFQAEFTPLDVEVSGKFAYLVDFERYGLRLSRFVFRVIDVSNPSTPIQVSELRDIGETPDCAEPDIEVSDEFVYVASCNLTVVDVSNPAMPVVVALLPDIYFTASIEVVDGYLYAAGVVWGAVNGVRYGPGVINVMDPANPFMVGHGSESTFGDSIAVVGGLAYVGGSGLTVFDVSDPAAPRRRGSIYATHPSDLAVYGGYAYLLTEAGLRVVDLSILDTPVEVGWAEVDAPAGVFGFMTNDVEVSNEIAYLAVGGQTYSAPGEYSGTGAVKLIDVSDPSVPFSRGEIETADTALDVELEGDLAYVAAGRDGLRVFDVSTPSAPHAAGGLALPGSTAKLKVIGTTAYVVDQGISDEAPSKLRIVDVSKPATPVELGTVEFPKASRFTVGCRAPDISVVDTLAYVLCRDLYIVDVSDPAQPALISATHMGLNFGGSIHVTGDLAYIGVDHPNSISVFDVSDPDSPTEVDSVEGGGLALRVEDGLAFGAANYGLVVNDLADPLRPVLIGGYPSDRGSWRSLAIANGLIYGATTRGLQIVDLGLEYQHPQPVEISIRNDAGTAAMNLASRGLIPVTLLGAADFDVTQIDRSSLRFGPDSARPAHKSGGHLADANGDGYADLLSHYWIADSGISETTVRTCVTGWTLVGVPFKGCGTFAATMPRGGTQASALAN